MTSQLTPIEEATYNAVKKRNTWKTSKWQYFMKCMLAGVFIGFGIMVSYKTGEYFFDTGSPGAMVAVALFFGIALVMIILSGAELFTSNTMTMTFGSIRKETTWFETLQVWLVCYFGNLTGALFFSILIMLSGLYESPDKSQLLMEVAGYKTHASFMAIFIKAILCNWLVCLAIWIPMHLKNESAKIFVTLLLVFAFVISGYEHSIANMALFGIALFVPHPDTITLGAAIHNLIPATLGNIVGGSVFVAGIYAYLNQKATEKKDSAVDVPLVSAKQIS